VAYGLFSPSSHRISLKTLGNLAFFAMGGNEPHILAIQFKIANKINGFKHISHDMARVCFFSKKLLTDPLK
jgi:hypothetical protein